MFQIFKKIFKRVKEIFNLSEDDYIYNEFENYIKLLKCDENVKIYIQKRVLSQIKWYDEKSNHNKNCFKTISISIIILNALVPVMNIFNLEKYFYLKVTLSIISSIVTVLTSINCLLKYKELWIQYRNSCEKLKSLLHQYFNGLGIFKKINESERNSLLIAECESIFSLELSGWVYKNIEKHKN